ncbi:hypothetical protein [Streptomyces sp. NPDC007083]|uniref:hypothetical protein n=1 Tax=Streptomyces sp. NPDC007083 TaxID=3156913 RepID=UPI0033C7E518
MTSTKNEESGEQAGSTVYRRRSFIASSDSALVSADTEAQKHDVPAGALMSRGAAVGGVSMGAAALLCFVLAAGFSGGEAGERKETAQDMFSLREQIKRAEAQAEALPEPKDADRGLVTAQSSAEEIAKLQNDYRHLSSDVAEAGGVIDEAAALSTRRNLTPFFAPSVDQSALDPWYLLASDTDTPEAVGIPLSFDSGFEWVAQRPYGVNADSTVTVTWLAVETRPGKDQTPAVLAWARADYDMTRKAFANVKTGTTATGEALRLKVKTP